jgi:hypothetical protein
MSNAIWSLKKSNSQGKTFNDISPDNASLYLGGLDKLVPTECYFDFRQEMAFWLLHYLCWLNWMSRQLALQRQ